MNQMTAPISDCPALVPMKVGGLELSEACVYDNEICTTTDVVGELLGYADPKNGIEKILSRHEALKSRTSIDTVSIEGGQKRRQRRLIPLSVVAEIAITSAQPAAQKLAIRLIRALASRLEEVQRRLSWMNIDHHAETNALLKCAKELSSTTDQGLMLIIHRRVRVHCERVDIDYDEIIAEAKRINPQYMLNFEPKKH